MKLNSGSSDSTVKKGGTLVYFVTEESSSRIGNELPAFVSGLDLSFFKGKNSETFFLPSADGPWFVLCGLGKTAKISRESLRNAAAGAAGLCREKHIKNIHVSAAAIPGQDARSVLLALAEGLYLANYAFDKYKSKNGENGKGLLERAVFLSETDLTSSLREIEIISGNSLLCRDLINETSDNSNSLAIAAEAKKLSRMKGITCKVYGKKDIEKMKMGLLLAVNRGSKYPPQLVVLKYTGNPSSKKYIALVGKGITFDSGGINLKPSGSIETMRSDMSGAAAVLYAVKSASELGLKKNVCGVFPLTDNMLTNGSYRPGDVFRAYNGKTVEIGNTDAEGRLILADAIAFTEDRLKPEVIIDIATLTGACIIALGECVAAFLTENDGIKSLLESSASETGEKVWQLPIVDEYEDNMKSDIADLNNISSEKNAGTIMGAIFLKNFIKDVPWAHIDIAGTSWYSKARGYRPRFATGFGVRLFVQLIRSWK